MLADENFTGVGERVERSLEVSVGHHELQMLGGIGVGHGGCLGEVGHEHTPAVHAERCPGGSGAYLGQEHQLPFEFGVDRIGQGR